MLPSEDKGLKKRVIRSEPLLGEFWSLGLGGDTVGVSLKTMVSYALSCCTNPLFGLMHEGAAFAGGGSKEKKRRCPAPPREVNT